jgi:anti-anti-sigma factor
MPRLGTRGGDASKPLEVEVHWAGFERDTHVVEARGEIDLGTVHLLQQQLKLACARGDETPVVADLSACDFMDSSGIHALLGAANGDGRSSRLIAVLACGGPRRVLEVSGADQVVPVLTGTSRG